MVISSLDPIHSVLGINKRQELGNHGPKAPRTQPSLKPKGLYGGIPGCMQRGTARCGTAQRSEDQSSTAQHITAEHSIAKHSTAQKSIAQHSIAQHSIAQHSTAQCSILQNSTTDIAAQ